ncbi:PLP-dependent aminotransferase family protein [Priestia aryabhattai]|uniref:MocR-like pyridoxine biosynthesis transcription factor PdxR n=1 Tax=Priestia aryabhattai TaxID=412384 RepID=UPI003D2688C5
MVEVTPFLLKDHSPLYVQLYEHIKNEIKEDVIPLGSKLPSIRALSNHLNISNNTVALAYELLREEDYIESKPRSGMYVKQEIDEISCFTTEEISKENIESSLQEIKEYQYDFHYGTVDSTLFPFKMFNRIANDIYYQNQYELFKYGHQQGEPGFRNELHKYLCSSRGVKCQPEQIIVTSGTQQSLTMLSQLINIWDRSVGFEEPGYNGARIVFENLKAELIPIELTKDGICMEELNKTNPGCLYVTPSHQFPNGYIMSMEKRHSLLQWAYDNDSWVIEDDYDSEFKYHGRPVQSIQGIGCGKNVIYLGTFSKSFLPSIRISYMVLPYKLLQKYRQSFALYEQTVPRIHQWILEEFMKTDDWNKHIKRMRSIYRKKHIAIMTAIKEYLDTNKLKVLGKDSGLHLLIKFNGKTEEELIELAEQVSVKVYPTSQYWKNKQRDTNGTVLLGFGALSEKQIKEGIKLLSKVWL